MADRNEEYGEVPPASSEPKWRLEESPSSPSAPVGRQSSRQIRRHGAGRVVFGIAIIVLVSSLVALGAIVFSYWEGQHKYDEIAQEAFPQADDLAAAGVESIDLQTLEIDWEALRAINSDVVGWIYIPGTVVNYPIVHTTDNAKYLSTDFQGDHGWLAQFGCIFLACENSADFTDANNVIFGHHMNDGSMFGFIDGLFDAERFAETRDVFLLTPDGNYRLRTFALITCNQNEPIAQTVFSSAEEFQAYVQDKVQRTPFAVDSQIDLDSIDRIFSLVTCDNVTSEGREVLFAAVVESTVDDGDAVAATEAAAALTQ